MLSPKDTICFISATTSLRTVHKEECAEAGVECRLVSAHQDNTIYKPPVWFTVCG